MASNASSDALGFPVRGMPKAVREKNIIFNVIKYFEDEKERHGKQKFRPNAVMQKAAEATGVPLRTLQRLRLLTHVQVSVRCLFKDDQFSLLVWLLLSLLLLCFHIQKQLILHALAINPSVLIELHLGISNMHHLIVGQVGRKIITSITGGEESNPL